MGYCKPCQRAYVNKRRKTHRKVLTKIARTAKDIPCTDCGERHPYWAMDFDHINPSNKKYNIADLVGHNVSKEVLFKEIDKCEVVCALCHTYRTYGEKRKHGVSRSG